MNPAALYQRAVARGKLAIVFDPAYPDQKILQAGDLSVPDSAPPQIISRTMAWMSKDGNNLGK
ncbi:MAG: hypothetical protein ACLQVD_05755 [Capsulimonadaceae bacterium]